MRTLARLTIIALLSGGALAARAAEIAKDAAPSFTNLAGESCQLSPRSDIFADPAAPPPAYLTCGGSQHDSGAITLMPMPLTLPTDINQRRNALVAVANGSAAWRQASSRMACHDGRWLDLGADAAIFAESCSLVEGEWPYLQILAILPGYMLQIEGLPVNLPALVDAALRLSASPPDGLTLAQPDQARALLAKIYGERVPLVTGAELDHFTQLTEDARLANSHSDYHAAEDFYRQALLILERAQSKDSPGVGKILMELALEISNQGRADEAAALFRRADPIIQRSPNPPDQARLNSYLAFDAANGGRFADALSFARAAVSQWRTLADSDGPSLDNLGDDSRSVWRGELAHSLNTQAAMALRTGDLAEAEASAKEALEIIGDGRNLPPWWLPEVLTTLGRIHAALGRLNEAEESFRGALVYQQRLFGDTAPKAGTLLSLAGVYADEGFYDDSLRAYDAAAKILAQDDIARSLVPFDQVAPMLQAASAIAERDPDRSPAMQDKIFDALQLMSGGVADQTIAKASARLATQSPEIGALMRELQDSERQRDAARISLAHETSLPDEQRGSLKEAALLAEINQRNAEHAATLAKLTSQYPAYTELTHPKPVSLALLRSQLRAHEALLMVQIGRGKSFAILVTAAGLTAKPLDIDQARMQAAVLSLRKAFAGKGGRLAEFDLAQSYALYRSLFAPLEDKLGDIDQLVLVQSGALASLPAALLVTAPPGNDGDYRHAAWLVRRFATQEIPSIAAFEALRGRAGSAKSGGRAFFGIGNPQFQGEPAEGAKGGLATIAALCRDDGPFPADMLRSLAPLPDTATELTTVARALGADESSLLLGAAATESNVRKQDLSDVRVLYFATHALLPGELSCQSEPALALSPPPITAATRDADGLLDASEVAGLTLDADLVVLSACNTGQTDSKFGGQALSGLAEAFFYAGARSLLASHWQVPSGATARLMVGLFERLTADPAAGPARALRLAQLALLDHPETSHPFFWAAFTLIGDFSPPAGAAALSANWPAEVR